MKTLIFLLAAVSISAGAQVVEKADTKGSTREEKSTSDVTDSKGRSVRIEKTYTPGALFFGVLSDLEAQKNSVQVNFSDGAGKVCSIFQGAYVWGDPLGALVERSQGVITKIHEPLIMKGQMGNVWGYVKEATEILRPPLTPEFFLGCVMAYQTIIDFAMKRMIDDAENVGGVYVLNDIKGKAKAALYAGAIDFFGQLKVSGSETSKIMGEVPLMSTRRVECQIPTASGFIGGSGSFQCGAWVVEQRPLVVYNSARIILSDDTVNGVKYSFADSVDVVRTDSRSTSKGKTSTKSTSTNKRVKVQSN